MPAILAAQPIAETLVREVVEHHVLEQPETEVHVRVGVSCYAPVHAIHIPIISRRLIMVH